MSKITIPPKEKTASFDVHAQKTFTPLCPEELPVPRGHKIVDELNAQAEKASIRVGSKEAHNIQAIWVTRNRNEITTPISGKNVDVKWPPHAIPGTKGFELLDGLPHPIEYNYFVWEGVELDLHPYGACYHDIQETVSTGAIEFLRAKKINTVLVGGLATDYCVKTTALQLRRAGFNVIVNLGACGGLAEDSIQKAIREMEKAGIKFVDSADELINEK